MLSLFQTQDRIAHLVFTAKLKRALDVGDAAAINGLVDFYKAQISGLPNRNEGDSTKLI